ncbi:hypothetical protein [Ferroplasma sp.]|uniref:hypothetical protein n=1 Tax=Ferroplasma sp. TaxID=2591003 RepID=UPI00307D6121
MQRIVIAAVQNGSGENTENPNLTFFEEIFKEFGKTISENEIVFTYSCKYAWYPDQSFISISSILNTYDRIKYRAGYSRDIVPVPARVEISRVSSANNALSNNKNGDRNGVNKLIMEPVPVDVLEKSAIMALLSDGYLPIVIPDFPVAKELQYYSDSKESVDIYSASSLLATLIEADKLIIISERRLAIDNIETLKNIKYARLRELFYNSSFKDPEMLKIIGAMLDFIYKGGKATMLISSNMEKVIDIKK